LKSDIIDIIFVFFIPCFFFYCGKIGSGIFKNPEAVPTQIKFSFIKISSRVLAKGAIQFFIRFRFFKYIKNRKPDSV